MTKIAEPYRCDGPGCGKQRSSDANHWWLIRFVRMTGGSPQIFIEVMPWDPNTADLEATKHGCGINCMSAVVGNMAAQLVDESKRIGKETANGAQN
jgi:hypothetical protein